MNLAVIVLAVLLVISGCVSYGMCWWYVEQNVEADFPDVEAMHVRQFVSEDELRAFLRQDKTNENEYVQGVYDCNEFAHDLMYAARAKGFDVWVYPHKWDWEEDGMWHVANCTRIGEYYWLIYPQADRIEKLAKWHGGAMPEMTHAPTVGDGLT